MMFMGMRPCRRASPADAMSQPCIIPLKRPGAFEQTAALQFNARVPDVALKPLYQVGGFGLSRDFSSVSSLAFLGRERPPGAIWSMSQNSSR